MQRIVVAVDGSDSSLRAVGHVINSAKSHSTPPEIHLLNVQYPLRGSANLFINADAIKQHHHDEGLKALEKARAMLAEAGLSCIFHIVVGEPAEIISRYAREQQCDEIVMGPRGLGSLSGLLLGSVATKVIHLADVPVLLVK